MIHYICECLYSKYAVSILMAKWGDGVTWLWSWCVQKGLFPSDKALMVEKYHGTMDYMVKGRVFILSMMMKNNAQSAYVHERGNEDGFWSDR